MVTKETKKHPEGKSELNSKRSNKIRTLSVFPHSIKSLPFIRNILRMFIY